MRTQTRACIYLAGLALLLALPTVALPTTAAAQQTPAPTPAFTVNGRVALAALLSLGDGHIAKMADSLQILAAAPVAASGDWEQIRGPLADVGTVNVPAVLWFAKPDGTYWTVESGLAEGNLADRPYFARLLAGQRVLGDLVVSKSTGWSVAIAAVPIFGPGGAVTGMLGSSIQLDSLSERIRQEMALDDRMIFYSFDATPLLALVWDPDLILADPMQLGEDVAAAFQEMLAHEEGTVTYTFQGTRRTVMYRRSPVTQWWYAFGVLENDPPVLTVPAKLEAVVGSLVTFTASATDPNEGDTLTFSLSGAPAGAAIDPATGAFTWTPASAGPVTFDVTVSDGQGGTDTEPVTITVAEVTPVLIITNATPNRTSSPKGGTYTLTVRVGVTNPNSTTVTEALITTATIDGVATDKRLPLRLGSIKPGATRTFVLLFKSAPSGATALRIEGTCSLGAFARTQEVTVP